MGGFLDKPLVEKSNQLGSGNGLRFAQASMQGWRLEMEDAHTARTTLNSPYGSWSYFAVFDGHAGSQVAAHCSTHLLSMILSTQQFSMGQYLAGIRAGFLQMDNEIGDLQHLKTGGTTAVCVFVAPQTFYFANCGDSRAVLARHGRCYFSTSDHKPSLALERARINNAGGSVVINRVNGTLAVSRALGDFDFKGNMQLGQCAQLISPEPDLIMQQRNDNDQFLVIGCDGVWDVMSNDDICAYINSRLCVTSNLKWICNSVLDVCLYKGSRDNITLIIVLLPNAPKVNAAAVAADNRLDDVIKEMINEVLDKQDMADFDEVIRTIISKQGTIKNLPPGGGIYSKLYVAERVFRKRYPNIPEEFSNSYAVSLQMT